MSILHLNCASRPKLNLNSQRSISVTSGYISCDVLQLIVKILHESYPLQTMAASCAIEAIEFAAVNISILDEVVYHAGQNIAHKSPNRMRQKVHQHVNCFTTH
ncbi:unnamed protein product [Clavelina lepadiformis]|uniref:Histone H2A/H2B/H3 domain-containing protein n=1 Tax=Clavelina lepadiformis TaxID=159417 RepID=A0ABP0F4L8_CLALP